MVKCLEEEGITRIFGYPGVAISPFYAVSYTHLKLTTIGFV